MARGWGIQPTEFWNLSPAEFWLEVDMRIEDHERFQEAANPAPHRAGFSSADWAKAREAHKRKMKND